MNIILIGMKHSGKSSIGKNLSLILNRKFFDIDEIIKKLFLKKYPEKRNFSKFFKIYEIYKFLKEEKFRVLESKAFFSIKDVKNSIIATAGGSILNEENFKSFKNPKIVVYLKASIETLKERIFNKNKSIFQDEKFLIKTFELRKVLYEKLADITIETKSNDIDQIAKEINTKIELKNPLVKKKYIKPPTYLKKIKNTEKKINNLYV